MGFGKSLNPASEEDILIAERAIDAALSVGITFFDHADIYSRGNDLRTSAKKKARA